VNGYLGSAQNQVLWKGHTKGAREILDRVPEKKNGGFILLSSWIELLDRRYEAALELLSSPYAFQPRKGISEGILYRLMKNPLLARASFDAARQRLEKRTREKPQDHDLHRFLGLAYAGLGRKAEAIREGKRATELVPVSKDALWGPEQIEDLAFIYLMVGEKNAAMDHLEYLLSIPYDLSIPLLRIDPRWDSIRNEPRFRKIVAESH